MDAVGIFILGMVVAMTTALFRETERLISYHLRLFYNQLEITQRKMTCETKHRKQTLLDMKMYLGEPCKTWIHHNTVGISNTMSIHNSPPKSTSAPPHPLHLQPPLVHNLPRRRLPPTRKNPKIPPPKSTNYPRHWHRRNRLALEPRVQRSVDGLRRTMSLPGVESVDIVRDCCWMRVFEWRFESGRGIGRR